MGRALAPSGGQFWGSHSPEDPGGRVHLGGRSRLPLPGGETRDGVCTQGAPAAPGVQSRPLVPTQGQSALSAGAQTWVGARSLPPEAPPPAPAWDPAARLAPGVVGMVGRGTGCGTHRGSREAFALQSQARGSELAGGRLCPPTTSWGRVPRDSAWCRTASWREAAGGGGRGAAKPAGRSSRGSWRTPPMSDAQLLKPSPGDRILTPSPGGPGGPRLPCRRKAGVRLGWAGRPLHPQTLWLLWRGGPD